MSPDAEWSSVWCDASRIIPHDNQWGSLCLAENFIYLRDTNSKWYKNKLDERGHLFYYCLPQHPKKEWEVRIVKLLSDGAQAYKTNPLGKTQEVRLFSVAHARDHYMGQFVVVDYARQHGRHVATLARLVEQSADVLDAYAHTSGSKRSKSEAMHLKWIRRVCPEPTWTVCHEPECAVNFNVPYVLAGKINPWASGQYTTDYIACTATQRVCFESKYHRSDVTEEALCKCRFLRDSSLNRVFVVAGHGEDMHILDLGSPAARGACEEWITEDEVRARLSLRSGGAT